jgi:hypothetical protein
MDEIWENGTIWNNFILNNIREKISQFWLAKSSAIYTKYNTKKWNTVQISLTYKMWLHNFFMYIINK